MHACLDFYLFKKISFCINNVLIFQGTSNAQTKVVVAGDFNMSSSTDDDTLATMQQRIAEIESENLKIKQELSLKDIELAKLNVAVLNQSETKKKAEEYSLLSEKLNKSVQEKESLKQEMEALQVLVSNLCFSLKIKIMR